MDFSQVTNKKCMDMHEYHMYIAKGNFFQNWYNFEHFWRL